MRNSFQGLGCPVGLCWDSWALGATLKRVLHLLGPGRLCLDCAFWDSGWVRFQVKHKETANLPRESVVLAALQSRSSIFHHLSLFFLSVLF